jgi:hypothetical protein
MATATHLRRLSLPELDVIGRRLEEIAQEEEDLRAKVTEQIQEYGFTPPRADKSKRLQAVQFQFTLSSSSSTEIRDSEVERIREACPDGLFAKLFTTVTKYKLAKDATYVLAGTLPEGAPRNLRMMFSRAVQVTEGSPRLRIEKLCEDVD